ncbi:MAG: SIR2 family NAD-dependent protein deacylase [Ignavibacteria bacterium]
MKFSNLLINNLLKANVVSVLTGAGISAESGVPTFRDPGGIWEKYRPEELANFEAFLSNPDFVWSWYQHRREIMQSVNPNSGHFAIAEMESLFPEFNLITQNIDNLHRRAGSKKVTELHGNIERNYCTGCRKFYNDISFNQKTVLKCECGGLIRPDVVWFGEILPFDALNYAEDCARKSDVFFTIGTSAEVYPAASLPLIAKHCGAYVVEINVKPTSISYDVDEVIEGKSGEVLKELKFVLSNRYPNDRTEG